MHQVSKSRLISGYLQQMGVYFVEQIKKPKNMYIILGDFDFHLALYSRALPANHLILHKRVLIRRVLRLS